MKFRINSDVFHFVKGMVFLLDYQWEERAASESNVLGSSSLNAPLANDEFEWDIPLPGKFYLFIYAAELRRVTDDIQFFIPKILAPDLITITTQDLEQGFANIYNVPKDVFRVTLTRIQVDENEPPARHHATLFAALGDGVTLSFALDENGQTLFLGNPTGLHFDSLETSRLVIEPV